MSLGEADGRGPSLQDLFALLGGLRPTPPDQNNAPIAEARADIARRARLPRTGGLFGGDYARFMADRAPQTPSAAGARPTWSADVGANLPASGASSAFGPQAYGVVSDGPTVDPSETYQVAGPAAGKAYPHALDPVIEKKVAAYNRMNQADPGDAVYLDPDLIKAMVRVESGYDPRAYGSDPMQVNNPRDWDDYKSDIGLKKGVSPGQELGVGAGLDWLDSKSYHYDGKGRPGPFLGYDEALRRYNGYHDGHGNPHYVDDVRAAYRNIKAGR
jgi:hypothetical protein